MCECCKCYENYWIESFYIKKTCLIKLEYFLKQKYENLYEFLKRIKTIKYIFLYLGSHFFHSHTYTFIVKY